MTGNGGAPSTCLACGRPLKQAKTGRPREFCEEKGVKQSACFRWYRAKEVMIGLTSAVTAVATPDALVELRYELFCFLGDEIPRVQNQRGGFRARGAGDATVTLGRCQTCGRPHRVRKDGMVGKHDVNGNWRPVRLCDGSGRPPVLITD